jgi:hypothetical protein
MGIVLPFWTSYLVRVYSWIGILKDQGLANSLLLHLGWIDAPLRLMQNTLGLYIGMVYSYLPYMILPLCAFLMKMDPRLPEAARDLGATPWEVFFTVTLPLSLPGITAGSEGTSGLFVRGGNSDQNLIVLDEAIVYNANHLFGFFSTFNSDAVKDVKVYKGGFPAQYGGRLSSVIDVRMKEGNNQKFSGSGGLGLISSRLTLEGPIQKGKSSFIVSGRRTYADIITRAINRANENTPDYNPIPDYYFYDLNTKINFTLGPKDRLFLSGYFGRDVFTFKNESFNYNDAYDKLINLGCFL